MPFATISLPSPTHLHDGDHHDEDHYHDDHEDDDDNDDNDYFDDEKDDDHFNDERGKKVVEDLIVTTLSHQSSQ